MAITVAALIAMPVLAYLKHREAQAHKPYRTRGRCGAVRNLRLSRLHHARRPRRKRGLSRRVDRFRGGAPRRADPHQRRTLGMARSHLRLLLQPLAARHHGRSRNHAKRRAPLFSPSQLPSFFATAMSCLTGISLLFSQSRPQQDLGTESARIRCLCPVGEACRRATSGSRCVLLGRRTRIAATEAMGLVAAVILFSINGLGDLLTVLSGRDVVKGGAGVLVASLFFSV